MEQDRPHYVFPPSLNDCISFLLRETCDRIAAAAQEQAKHANIDDADALLILCAAGGTHNQKQIGDMLHISNNQMVKHVDMLEKKKLVRRVRNEQNRREVLVTITNRGDELLKKIDQRHRECLSALNDSEYHEIKKLLVKIVNQPR